MRFVLAASLLALAACSKPAGAPSAHGGKIAWLDGSALNDALATAKKDGMPLMVYFTATW